MTCHDWRKLVTGVVIPCYAKDLAKTAGASRYYSRLQVSVENLGISVFESHRFAGYTPGQLPTTNSLDLVFFYRSMILYM